jgi:hypothetical protein
MRAPLQRLRYHVGEDPDLPPDARAASPEGFPVAAANESDERRPRTLRSRLLPLALSTALIAGPLASPAAAADDPARGASTFTFALLGDTPYGEAQRAQFPALVSAVDADPAVRMVLHAGDVKSGSSTCSDARFADLADLYGTFDDPFVLTPGDNDWTDCHRTTSGSYLPTERLEAIREVFFPRTGQTLGEHPMPVTSQSRAQREHAEYVENVTFRQSRVVFATVHVVGSENDLLPWDQLPGGDRPAERLAEFEARRAANLDWINAVFDTAERTHAPGMALLLQAEPLTTPGFQVERDLILQRAEEFGRPVLLMHGDEHQYEVEPGYGSVPNLTRLETFGDTASAWLRVTADPTDPQVFSWEPQTVPAA